MWHIEGGQAVAALPLDVDLPATPHALVSAFPSLASCRTVWASGSPTPMTGLPKRRNTGSEGPCPPGFGQGKLNRDGVEC